MKPHDRGEEGRVSSCLSMRNTLALNHIGLSECSSCEPFFPRKRVSPLRTFSIAGQLQGQPVGGYLDTTRHQPVSEEGALKEHATFWKCCCCRSCSVPKSCPTLCDPMDCSSPGFPVHHQFLELAQTHVHRVSDAI